MPVFPSPWPKTRPQALNSLITLLGPPPEGVFTKDFCPKHCHLAPHACKLDRRQRQEPLAKLALPEERQSLETLCVLGLDCLWWRASDRPETDYCLKFLKTFQAPAELSSEADFKWLPGLVTEARQPASSSSQTGRPKHEAAKLSKAAGPDRKSVV